MSDSQKKILRIADPEILAISIVECHEPLIDVKNHTEIQYGPPPECEATAPDYTKMRKSVFEKLCLAQKNLPSGWRFRLYEGFRSIKVQTMLFDNVYNKLCAHDSENTKEQHFYEATRLVSPVINLDGSRNIPPHNTGAAIDVELLDEHGQLIDMAMTAADWCHVDSAMCETHYPHISEQAKSNRLLLLKVMEEQGFVNYPTEWWHYSYGDRYWAYHKKMPHAIYGSVETSLF